MTEFNYVVGDKIRRTGWAKDRYVTITSIGIDTFLGRDTPSAQSNPRNEESWGKKTNATWGDWVRFGEATSAIFPFKVGDSIRRSNWPQDDYIVITAIGTHKVLGHVRGDPTKETAYDIVDLRATWVRKTLFPESWMNVYADGIIGKRHSSRADANGKAESFRGRIGVIHLAKNGVLTMEDP